MKGKNANISRKNIFDIGINRIMNISKCNNTYIDFNMSIVAEPCTQLLLDDEFGKNVQDSVIAKCNNDLTYKNSDSSFIKVFTMKKI